MNLQRTICFLILWMSLVHHGLCCVECFFFATKLYKAIAGRLRQIQRSFGPRNGLITRGVLKGTCSQSGTHFFFWGGGRSSLFDYVFATLQEVFRRPYDLLLVDVRPCNFHTVVIGGFVAHTGPFQLKWWLWFLYRPKSYCNTKKCWFW